MTGTCCQELMAPCSSTSDCCSGTCTLNGGKYYCQ